MYVTGLNKGGIPVCLFLINFNTKEMNKILCLLALLFCFAGCKKGENDTQVRFTKVTVFNKTDRNDLTIVYEGKQFNFLFPIGVAYGNDRFEILNKKTGEKIMDTVLNIAGADDFQLREVVPGGKPVLVRSPLSGEAAVSGEYMKLKIANHAPNALPYEKMDVVVMSFYEENGAYLRLDTLKGVGTDYNKELFMVKRSLLAGVANPRASYRFSFINSATGETVKDAKGRLYTAVYFNPEISRDNLYVFEFIEYADALDPDRAIERDGQTYDVETQLLWYR